MADEHIHTRLRVSTTHGIKLCLFDKGGAELYDKYTWTVHKNQKSFYLNRSIVINGKRTNIFFHRELLDLKDGEIRDHRNGNGLDNRICNLRPATQQENCCNQGIQKNNTSGIKGVSWQKSHNKWSVKIKFNGITYHLGYFDDIQEAEIVVRAKREELHGAFANHG